MDTVPVWAALVILGIIGTLVTWLWRGNDKRLDKHSDHIEDHADRITKLEEKVEQHQIEIATLRERWHDMTNHVSRALAEWYTQIVKMIRGDK